MGKEIINTRNAPAPIGPYSQSVKANGFLFISGQIGMDPETGNIETSSVAAESHRVMQNMRAILSEAGIDFSAVVKTTIFLTDMSLFSEVNAVYETYFTGNYPARETVAVKGLPKGVNVEISMIAAS